MWHNKTFSSMKIFNVRFCLSVILAAIAFTSSNASALVGSWRGELSLGQMKLPLVFNFTENASGVTVCTMDSPAQGARGIATEVVLCTADTVSLVNKSLGASYNGKISSGLIKGFFSQSGYKFPLDLTPDNSQEDRRPQTPRPPFPYTAIDTTFTAPDGAVMSATLTLPLSAKSPKIPAVVMVTGSGAQNRDEEAFEHKPFAVIADYLARNGIASLRYDDRGTAKSTGDFASATTFTLKDDALSGIDFLRSIGCIGKVGVLGHSEGGTIAFIIGAEGKADFLISLAGMAISGKETIVRQNKHQLDKSPLSDADKANSLKLIELITDVVISQTKKGETKAIDIEAIAAKNGLKVPQQMIESLRMTEKSRGPWFDTFLSINPRDYLRNIKCPLLAINGEKDLQVYPDNLEVIKEYAPEAQIRLMPGLNHLLQHAVTGEVSEYYEIRETTAPEALDAIASFIKNINN